MIDLAERRDKLECNRPAETPPIDAVRRHPLILQLRRMFAIRQMRAIACDAVASMTAPEAARRRARATQAFLTASALCASWAHADPANQDAAPEQWAVHGQMTTVMQFHPAFTSPYRGANTLDPGSRSISGARVHAVLTLCGSV